MKHLIKCGLVLVLFLLFCGVPMAQENESGREGQPTTTEQMPTSYRWVKALPDGDQPLLTEIRSSPPPKGTVGDRDLRQTPESPSVHTPVWKVLDELSLYDRQNALIQLEVPYDLPATLQEQVEEIERLWNSGDFKQAKDRWCNLEESQGLPDIALGISWKVPRVISNPKLGTDVQVGSREDVRKPCLDFHYGTKNLFVVLKLGGTSPAWTFNISTDSGSTWQETYIWSGATAIDLDIGVTASYVYVAYVVSTASDEARIRRFSPSDGSVDTDYYYKVIFDKDVAITEVALTTNADFTGSHIYHLAILTDNSLIYHWDTEGTLSWTEVATGIDDADHGLDACYNYSVSDYFVFVSFVGSGDSMHVARRSGSGWEDYHSVSWAEDITSIAAYQDRIMAVFENYFLDEWRLKYWISYDGGDNWYIGWLALPSSPERQFFSPDVTARRGGGFAVIYNEETGEPDTCWYTRRDYGTGPATAPWSDPVPINEVDVFSNSPTSVEWIPSASGFCHSYGAVWIEEEEPAGYSGAYFDRHGQVRAGDANGDGTVDLGDVLYLISYLYKGGPAPDPSETGDVDCSGGIDLGDVLYLIAYLYKGGPAPRCC